jgi:hypothetical protein
VQQALRARSRALLLLELVGPEPPELDLASAVRLQPHLQAKAE